MSVLPPSTTTPDLPMFKGARVSGNCLTMLKDLHTTLLDIRILCITNKCVKCVSQLVRDLGCCLRVHAHSVVLAFCYFYLNQICLLLISLLIHCGSGSFCLSSYMIKLCKTKWQKKNLICKMYAPREVICRLRTSSRSCCVSEFGSFTADS